MPRSDYLTGNFTRAQRQITEGPINTSCSNAEALADGIDAIEHHQFYAERKQFASALLEFCQDHLNNGGNTKEFKELIELTGAYEVQLEGEEEPKEIATLLCNEPDTYFKNTADDPLQGLALLEEDHRTAEEEHKDALDEPNEVRTRILNKLASMKTQLEVTKAGLNIRKKKSYKATKNHSVDQKVYFHYPDIGRWADKIVAYNAKEKRSEVIDLPADMDMYNSRICQIYSDVF